MKYTIHYECKSDNETFSAQVDVECETEPHPFDAKIIEAMQRDSVRFHNSGAGSIRVTSITPINRNAK